MEGVKKMFSAFISNARFHGRPGWDACMAITRFWALAHVTSEYGVTLTVCIGPSMMPTMQQNGDAVCIHQITS